MTDPMTTPPLDLTALNLRGLRLAVDSKSPQDNFTIGTDHMAALLDHIDALTARAEAAEKKIAAVRELHKPVEVYEYDDTNGVFVTGDDDEKVIMATLCGTCTSATIIENAGDCDYEMGLFDEVQYPCPTITALNHHTPETETP